MSSVKIDLAHPKVNKGRKGALGSANINLKNAENRRESQRAALSKAAGVYLSLSSFSFSLFFFFFLFLFHTHTYKHIHYLYKINYGFNFNLLHTMQLSASFNLIKYKLVRYVTNTSTTKANHSKKEGIKTTSGRKNSTQHHLSCETTCTMHRKLLYQPKSCG
jgi:hypothetical protein